MSHIAVQAAAAPEKSGGLQAVARAGSAPEHQAERFADAVTGGDGAAWSFADVPVHAETAPRQTTPTETAPLDVRLDGPGQPLAPELHGLGPGVDLAVVRVHTDSSAADTSRRAGAQAVTVGTDIAFAPSAYQPATPAGRRRIAHELGHVAQGSGRRAGAVVHRDGTGPVTPATTLDGLPESQRKGLQVVTNIRFEAPTQEKLKKTYFDKGTTIPGPSDAAIALDASVPVALVKGVTNLAGDWSIGSDPVLKPNTTFTIELDLTAQGGSKGPYRFTYSQPPAAKGKTVQGRILVEQLGQTSPPAGTTKPSDLKPGQPAPDPVADKLKAASITYSSYAGAEEEALRAAISLVPAAHLATLSGLKFGRAAADKDPKVSGKYFPKEHKIVMYDKAFAATDVKFVQANSTGSTAASYATRMIIHEIGHAVDLRSLNQAWEAKDAASKAVNDAAGTFTSAAEKKRYDDAVKAETAAARALKDARSRSGTKTVEKPTPAGQKPDPTAPKDYDDVIGTTAAGNAFREAVKKDGKDVSKYAEEDFQESYAEAYSLFVTTPGQLKSLRPATYDYLVKNTPR